MKPKKRQKICYNCEGEIDLDVIVCPFCAADLREEKPTKEPSSYSATATIKNLNTQQSLYPSHFSAQENSAPSEPAVIQSEEEESPRQILGPVILLTLGSQLLLLGLLMLLFSNNGVLLLKWDARFWFFYLLASVPLIIFGHKYLTKI